MFHISCAEKFMRIKEFSDLFWYKLEKDAKIKMDEVRSNSKKMEQKDPEK